MTWKDIIIILLLIVVLIILAKIMQMQKVELAMVGALTEKFLPEETETSTTEKPHKLPRKEIARKIVKLFDDGKPRTVAEIQSQLPKKFESKKINNMLWQLKSRSFLEKEKLEEGTVWGLAEWFTDGKLSEDYFKKLKS